MQSELFQDDLYPDTAHTCVCVGVCMWVRVCVHVVNSNSVDNWQLCCLCVQSELFQDDLYPDTAGDEPSISAEDFFAGKNADPILVGNWDCHGDTN